MSASLHVVGLVGNDITNDSRVKKVAASVAAAGFRSTIVCYTTADSRIDTSMGEVEVIRVPVPFHAHNKNGRVPGPLHPFNGAELGARHVGPRAHLLARRRWLEAAIANPVGGIGQLWSRTKLVWTRVSLKVRHEVFRARRRAHVEIERAIRILNRWRVRSTLRLLRRFRDPVPNIADYENSFGPILEELAPDLIHAHDFHMIGIAVTAATRISRSGKRVRVVYDAHEWIPGLSYPNPVLRGWLKLQSRYITLVDAVCGISPEQIDQLQELYQLDRRPTLVMNAPPTVGVTDTGSDIRSDLGVSGRILTYHGNIQLERGLGTLIESLPFLDADVHVAILAPKNHPMVQQIGGRADELGVAPRVHVLDYVAAHRLAHYLSTADVSIIPYLPTGNNDIALPNKLFESVQAGLPLVVSNMRSMSRMVSERRIGEVFDAGVAEDLAEKVKLVLSDANSYRLTMTNELKSEFSWDAQADRLIDLYCGLLEVERPKSRPLTIADTIEDIEGAKAAAGPKLAIGPRNMAGQAYRIAEAVQTNLDIPAISISMANPKYHFPIHLQISESQWRDPAWQREQLRFLTSGFTHVVAESGTGMLGSSGGGFIDEQLAELQAGGLAVAVILHGSEIRNPDRHRALPFSPYAQRDDFIRAVEDAATRLRSRLGRVDVPFFVTTPDLLEDIESTWLPVVVDAKRWSRLAPPFQSPIPTVLHLPTSSRLKGSEYVDIVLRSLDAEGKIRYLRPVTGTVADNVPELVESADIVIDQIVIGAYGLMSCQAMAAGRLSIANIRDIGFLGSECPVTHADPDNLDQVMRGLLADRTSWETRARAGRDYVEKYHNGEATARILEPFLSNG